VGLELGKGRQKKNPGKTTYICASSQKKVRTYLFFDIIFYSAFLGVSRQGTSKSRKHFLSTFPKKHRGNVFSGGNIFFGWIF
jgi:hypothetical protein